MADKNITQVLNAALQKYPGSEMTIKSITETGAKLEKITFNSLPGTKKFSDAEIIMVQFVGAMICNTIKDPKLRADRITAFCEGLKVYANTFNKLMQNK